MEYNNKVSKVAYGMLQDIRGGKYPKGQFMPIENSLASRYNTSRITVRKVLGILEDKGIVERIPYKGVVVKDDLIESFGSETTQQKIDKQITIGTIIAGADDALIVNIKDGIRQYCENNNFDLQLFVSPSSHDLALNTLQNINQANINGIIVYPYPLDSYKNALNKLIKNKFPVVLVDQHFNNLPVSSVESDNSGGAYQATLHLIEKHKRPVHFLGTTCCEESIAARLNGYKLAMQHSGFECFDNLIIKSEIHSDDTNYWPFERKVESSQSMIEDFIKNCDLPASIFCANDYIAASLYKVANKHKLTIGKDLAVVGFDDSPIAKLLKPELTTVRQNPQQIGAEAAKILHQLINGQAKAPLNVWLPVELIIRESD